MRSIHFLSYSVSYSMLVGCMTRHVYHMQNWPRKECNLCLRIALFGLNRDRACVVIEL